MVSAPRQFASRFLRTAAQPGDFAEHRLESDPGFCALRPADRRLAQELILGVLRWRVTLDWLVARRTGGRGQEPAVQDLLRLGLYQLFWLDRVPDHAVVHDAVQLCRNAGLTRQSGFVNALLRGCIRERDAIRAALSELRASDPATAGSHPAWLVERWRGRMDPESLARLLEWNNTPPPTWARVNTLRTTAGALEALWNAEGVAYRGREFPWAPSARLFELQGHPPLGSLRSFTEGGFYIQDPSTLMAVGELNPLPGERILDLCAAPGGKTTYIAQCMGNTGRIVAHDPSASRLELLRENCIRLGVTTVEAVTELPPPAADADGVLVDAPCSNTGVLRRRVESRWRLLPEELPRLAGRQLDILRDAALRVRPGGRLVYSTCSLEPLENRGVVDRFLEESPEFVLESERLLHPVTDAVDGAYAARLRRRGGLEPGPVAMPSSPAG